MKKAIFAMLLLFSVLVFADEATLLPGRSYNVDDRNVTLIQFDPIGDKTLFCVNGVKWIIAEDDQKTINDVYIDVIKIKSDRVVVDIEYKCKDCVCDESCDNSVCFNGEQELADEEPEEDDEVIFEPEEIEPSKEEVIEPSGIGTQGVIIAVLVIIVLVAGLIVLWRRV